MTYLGLEDKNVKIQVTQNMKLKSIIFLRTQSYIDSI
jgi:hypothetical protein